MPEIITCFHEWDDTKKEWIYNSEKAAEIEQHDTRNEMVSLQSKISAMEILGFDAANEKSQIEKLRGRLK